MAVQESSEVQYTSPEWSTLTPEQQEAANKKIEEWILRSRQAIEESTQLKGKDMQAAWFDLKKSLDTTFPATTDIPSDINPDEVAKAATATQELQKVADTGNPDTMNKAFANIDNVISWLPPGLKKFFEGIMNFFKNLWWVWDKSKDATINSDKIKDPEQWKILDKYGISVNNENPKSTKLITQNWSKVEGMKSPRAEIVDPLNKIEWKDIDQTKPIPIPLNKDGSIDINSDNFNSIDIKDNESGCTITVKNKDGSTDTYVIKSDKKVVTSTEWTKPI